MEPVLKKLNHKAGQSLLVLNAPESFKAGLATLADAASLYADLDAAPHKLSFALAFVTRRSEIENWAPALAQRLPGDALLWFAYPKQTSKRYACDFNRDTGWEALGALGWEGVRQVAIDADWSALRFRRVEHIKKFTRRESMALTPEGKKRAAGQ